MLTPMLLFGIKYSALPPPSSVPTRIGSTAQFTRQALLAAARGQGSRG